MSLKGRRHVQTWPDGCQRNIPTFSRKSKADRWKLTSSPPWYVHDWVIEEASRSSNIHINMQCTATRVLSLQWPNHDGEFNPTMTQNAKIHKDRMMPNLLFWLICLNLNRPPPTTWISFKTFLFEVKHNDIFRKNIKSYQNSWILLLKQTFWYCDTSPGVPISLWGINCWAHNHEKCRNKWLSLHSGSSLHLDLKAIHPLNQRSYHEAKCLSELPKSVTATAADIHCLTNYKALHKKGPLWKSGE